MAKIAQITKIATITKIAEIAKTTKTAKIANSGAASPKILGGGQNVWFSANSIILFRKTPLKAQNDYIPCSCV